MMFAPYIVKPTVAGTDLVRIYPPTGSAPEYAQASSLPAAGTGTLSITDGIHTVAAATGLTITGGTVGGTTPNATLTVNTQISGLTPGALPLAATSSTLGNSAISDNGTDVTIAEPVILTGQTTVVAGSGAGTLLNMPVAGNPTIFLQLSVNGTTYVFPGWPA